MTELNFTAAAPSPDGSVLVASDSRPRGKKTCRHCGAPLLDARMVEAGFCCAGCSYVYRIVHEHGLAGYYNIKDNITAPADPAVFQPRDYHWLEQAQVAAESTADRIPEVTLDVQGISCAGCVWLIERVFQQQPGARDIFVNAQYGTMRIRWVQGQFVAMDFAAKLQGFGYIVGPAGEGSVEPESRALVKRIGLCAAFAMNVMLYALPPYFGMEPTFEWAGLFGLLSLGFATLSFLVGGTYFVGRAVRAVREGVMHIDLPIAIGIIGAYGGSMYGWLFGHERYVYFDFVSTFILLMLVGRWAQTAAVERNRRRLLSRQPRLQNVRLENGNEIAAEHLEPGQAILVSPGQTVPVQSELRSAQAQFSLASINGEAEPRILRAGEIVAAGAVNVGRQQVRLATKEKWKDSLLAQLLAQTERAGATHALLERIVRGYIIGILVVAAAAGAGWWITTGDALRTGAVVTAILVVSCPCAVGLAFPLADEMATVALRRRGVFIREADLWNKLSRVRRLVFDKTGTLTLETPVLVNPEALRGLSDDARSALFAMVRDNPHPVSESLRAELLANGGVDAMSGDVVEEIGMGVEIDAWSLGRPGWRTELRHCAAGDTVLAFNGAVVARFRFADKPRSDAAREIDALRQRRLSIYILSGDRQEKVRALATELGLPRENAIGEATPIEKAKWLERNGAADAMMLGDGANDSLAFDRALCRGTPVIHRGVLERKADFYYLGRGLGGLRSLFDVDRVRRRTHLTILIFSVAYNAMAVGLAVAGVMNPLLAAVLMPLNSLLTLALVTGGMRKAFSC